MDIWVWGYMFLCCFVSILPLPNSLMVMAVQYTPCICFFFKEKILVLRRRLDWILDRVDGYFFTTPKVLRVRVESSSGVVPPCAGYMDVASGAKYMVVFAASIYRDG